MLRAGELMMILAPIGGIVIMYLVLVRGYRISRRMLVLAVLGVFAFGGWLTWLGTEDRLDPSTRYVPAVLRNGEIVQGHGSVVTP